MFHRVKFAQKHHIILSYPFCDFSKAHWVAGELTGGFIEPELCQSRQWTAADAWNNKLPKKQLQAILEDDWYFKDPPDWWYSNDLLNWWFVNQSSCKMTPRHNMPGSLERATGPSGPAFSSGYIMVFCQPRINTPWFIVVKSYIMVMPTPD